LAGSTAENAWLAAEIGGQRAARFQPHPRREQDVLRLVNQRPGITVSQITKELGVDATGLYRPVHKLEPAGAIIKRAWRFSPPATDAPLA
jgi:DNA-binding MarR family transcriptional regulator